MRFSLLALMLFASATLADTVYLDSLDLSQMRQGWGEPQTNCSIRKTTLSIGGVRFARGVGTHAVSSLWVDLRGGSQRFSARVGVDDAANGPATIIFRITADGKRLYDSGVMKPGDKPQSIDLKLAGCQRLLLQVLDAGDGVAYDHADWADAQFVVTGPPPTALSVPPEPPILLTPPPGHPPRLNGPTLYGAHPGNPFLYRVPAQGARPMRFSAKGLPASLQLDPQTGIITGQTPPAGDYRITLKARNRFGKDSRLFRIRAGDKLALTPPMGWNHWYAHYNRITDAMVRQAADIILSSGMADVGYQYVNLDDCWMNAPKNNDPGRVGPARDAGGRILPNSYFPDMKGLADYIHRKGLKAGLYSSPGPLTCAGYTASYGHEELDAQTFAEWGFDFLKHDWCTYDRVVLGRKPDTNVPVFGSAGTRDVSVYQYPYQLMGDLLKRQPRDIVYNLCQYGMGNVWEWGERVGAQCWRTAGDLGFELDRIFEVALKNAEHRAWSRPGAWNDPDYIQIGCIGNARGGGLPEPCPLTANEQYAYMSLWSLMASPLFFSGDLGRLDEFTLNVLCNPEVIDINQDALGQCGAVSALNDDTFIMVKDLEDGSKAVGLFNRGEFPADVRVAWPVLGLQGFQFARDVWRQKDLGKFDHEFGACVPRHGVVLIKLSRAK